MEVLKVKAGPLYTLLMARILIVIMAKGDIRSAFKLSPNIKAFLEKPFSRHVLREAVAKALAPA